MGLIKKIREEKQVMLRGRFAFNYIILPVWAVVFVVLAVVSCVLGIRDFKAYAPSVFTCIAVAIAPTAFIVGYAIGLAKRELAVALQDYGYLFESTDGRMEAEALDEELGVKFHLKKDGVTIVFPKKDEEVFEELDCNTEFLPWSDLRMALASDNFGRRVRFAIVLIESAKAVDEIYEPYFLTMTKELYSAIVGLGLMEQMTPDFDYLLKNPKKGMKQILNFGYVRKFL